MAGYGKATRRSPALDRDHAANFPGSRLRGYGDDDFCSTIKVLEEFPASR